jgi:hypothetical protein
VRRGECTEGVTGAEKSGSGEIADEEIFEVCCEFLDERVFDHGVDGYGADHAYGSGEEEERKRDNNNPCTCSGYDDGPKPDDASGYGEATDGCPAGSAGCDDYLCPLAEVDAYSGQTEHTSATAVVCSSLRLSCWSDDVAHAFGEGGRVKLRAENLVWAVGHDGDAPVADEGDDLVGLRCFDR